MTFTLVLHYFLGAVLYPFLIFSYFGVIMTPKYTRRPFWFYAILATLLLQPINIGRMADENTVIFELMAYLQLAFVFGYALFLFKEKLWEKILLVFLWTMTSILSELIFSAGISDKITELDFTGDNPETMIYEIIIYIITFSILGAIGVAWKFVKRRSMPKNIWIFLLFPLSQYFMICNFPMDTYTGKVQFQYPWYTILGLLLGITADVILFYVMFVQGEKERIKQQLAETEKLLQMEKGYYETMESRREEMAKIRHDFSNQLTAALHIAQNGEQEKSVELLGQLRDEIEQFSEEKWCENSVINAVLSEKSKQCTRENVTFTAELCATEEMGIQPLHLCSVMTNLIDNAILAAAESGEKDAFVTVHAKQQERYFFIKVENTSKKPEKKENRPGHGYGLQILQSIAQRYNGEYKGSFESGVYTAVVILETTADKK